MGYRSWIMAPALALVTLMAVAACADVFNLPTGQTSLDFVTVGDPGNTGEPSRLAEGDPTYYGAVDYTYQIGKYDVTTAQYCEFLNAVAKTDNYGLYNFRMDAGYYSTVAITQSGSPGSYSYSVTGSYSEKENCPVFAVGWGDAARFCNWLHNGQPTGDQGLGTTETGAYTLNGAVTSEDLMAVTRNADANYFLPSEDEWYKAAFYKGGGTDAGYWLYPTQSDDEPSNVFSATGTNHANYYDGDYTDPTNKLTPVGAFEASPGPYGTYDMGGNLWKWNEAVPHGTSRGLRGGDCHLPSDRLTSSYYYSSPAADAYSTVGFRVASVPEPGTVAMLGGIFAMMLLYLRRKNCA